MFYRTSKTEEIFAHKINTMRCLPTSLSLVLLIFQEGFGFSGTNFPTNNYFEINMLHKLLLITSGFCLAVIGTNRSFPTFKS